MFNQFEKCFGVKGEGHTSSSQETRSRRIVSKLNVYSQSLEPLPTQCQLHITLHKEFGQPMQSYKIVEGKEFILQHSQSIHVHEGREIIFTLDRGENTYLEIPKAENILCHDMLTKGKACSLVVNIEQNIVSDDPIAVRLHVCQEGAERDSVTAKLFLTVEASGTQTTSTEASYNPQTSNARYLRSKSELDPSEDILRILRDDESRLLAVMLDVKTDIGNDWRKLAEKMGLPTNTIKWIEQTSDSPTMELLTFFCNGHIKSKVVHAKRKLVDMLNDIGLEQAAQLLQSK